MAEAEKLVLRANRKMFMGVVGTGSTVTYTRMRGFTTLSESKNPVEYSRKYIDETFETTDVTGMSPSYDFTFDRMTPNAVLDDIADIIDNETLGSDAVREFVCVDFFKPGTTSGTYEAVKRSFSIIGNTVGDGTDALTYSGTLRVQETMVKGTATIATPASGTPETVETIEFTEAAAE
jgi:hypothetical protein